MEAKLSYWGRGRRLTKIVTQCYSNSYRLKKVGQKFWLVTKFCRKVLRNYIIRQLLLYQFGWNSLPNLVVDAQNQVHHTLERSPIEVKPRQLTTEIDERSENMREIITFILLYEEIHNLIIIITMVYSNVDTLNSYIGYLGTNNSSSGIGSKTP